MNFTLLQTLPRKTGGTVNYAQLAKLDGSFAWKFLLMPREISFKKASSYASTATGGNIPLQQFAATEGWAVSMTIPLYNLERDITDHATELSSLLNPEPHTPPALIWQWGTRKISPAVMTQCDRSEFDWFPDGRLRGCNLQVSLIEINPKSLVI